MVENDSIIFQIERGNGDQINQAGWPVDGCDPSNPNDQKADVAVLRFGDDLCLDSEKSLDQVVHLIKQDSKTNANGVVVLLFTHGWNHSATWSDSNFVSFRKILIGLALREAERYVDGKEAGRRIIGIYVGWRGTVFKNKALQFLFTFPGRYHIAKKIGASNSLQVALAKIIETTKSLNVTSPVILAGHSLGALMLESALASILDPQKRFGRDGPVQFPDLVLFLNSAAEVEIAKQIQNHIKTRRPPPKNIEYRDKSFEGPLFVSAASESDRVTKYLFRLAKFGSKTDGNTKSMFTHQLKQHEVGVICNPMSGRGFGQSWHCLRPPSDDAGKLRFDIDLPARKNLSIDDDSTSQDESHVRYRLTQDKHSPFWIFQAPKHIMDGHNDVFNERSALLMMVLIQLSGALMSLAIDYHQTFDNDSYKPN